LYYGADFFSFDSYGSQHCDPGKDHTLWNKWHGFEVRHGNEDTFRDMLRIKRSVQLQFSQQHVNTTDTAAALIQNGPASKRQKISNDMEKLERQMMNEDMRNLVEAPSLSRGGDIVATGGDETSSVIPVAGSARNTDEIAIDDDDDDEMLEDGAAKGPTGKQQMARMNLVEKAIPAAVYGGLMKEGEAPSGALARFKSQK
jgi:pre-mRNA-splicing factor SYF1